MKLVAMIYLTAMKFVRRSARKVAVYLNSGMGYVKPNAITTNAYMIMMIARRAQTAVLGQQ